MNNFISRLIKILLPAILLPVAFSSHAQAPLDDNLKQQIIASMAGNREGDWETLSISGKLRMEGLPLSPSMKISMEKDSSILISLRAPLVGEVGRAEIIGDTVIMVNKMKKCFVKESISSVTSSYPVSVGNIQDLILAHVVLPGYGLPDIDVSPYVDVYYIEDEGTFLLPGETLQLPMADYGYQISNDFRPEQLLVMIGDEAQSNIIVSYDYYPKGYDMLLEYITGNRSLQMELELDNPVYGSSSLSPMNIGKGYRQMSLSDFMRSF